jgi:hypothetical protein
MRCVAHRNHHDVRQSADGLSDREGLKERVASRLDRIEVAAGRRMTRGNRHKRK